MEPRSGIGNAAEGVSSEWIRDIIKLLRSERNVSPELTRIRRPGKASCIKPLKFENFIQDCGYQ